jgi:hypothetical protein
MLLMASLDWRLSIEVGLPIPRSRQLVTARERAADPVQGEREISFGGAILCS